MEKVTCLLVLYLCLKAIEQAGCLHRNVLEIGKLFCICSCLVTCCEIHNLIYVFAVQKNFDKALIVFFVFWAIAVGITGGFITVPFYNFEESIGS